MDRNLKKLLFENAKALRNSKMDFRAIYEIVFSHGELVMAEGSDGFRVWRQTYGEMRSRVEALSRAIYARIGASHSFVGLEMENCREWVVAFWAILRSGNKPYLVNCRHPLSLRRQLAKRLNLRYVLALEPSELEAETLLYRDLTDGPAFPESFEDELALASSGTSLNETICFYRGEQFAYGILNAEEILKISPRMASHYKGRLKQLCFLPFYHIYGLMAVFFWFTFFGRTLVFLRDYAPDTILKTCRKHEVTHIFAVPMLWHTIEKQVLRTVKELGKEEKFRRGLKLAARIQNISPYLGARLARGMMSEVTKQLFGNSVQFCISGGSYLRASALELVNGLGYPLHNGFGMSELGITSVELRKTPKERNENSVGRPFQCVEYRISQRGTLEVKSKTSCKKLLVNGVLTDCPEWLDTGDLMHCEKGNYFISGRVGDMVLGENGENINPDLIEAHFHPQGARNLCVLGLGEGENQELSMILQISPYLPEEQIESLVEECYRINESLPDASRVRKFYFTHEALAAETAIKVSRRALLRALERGEVKITTAAQMKQAHAKDETLECNPVLYADVLSVVAREQDIPEEKIGPNDHVIFDLGGSSLQYFAILSALAQQFGISAPSDKEEYRYTLREFCQYIERHM